VVNSSPDTPAFHSVSPSSGRGRHYNRTTRRSPGSDSANKKLGSNDASPSSSSSSSSGRSPSASAPFRRSASHGTPRHNHWDPVKPVSLASSTSSRVRRSRSLQLPERRSPASPAHDYDHPNNYSRSPNNKMNGEHRKRFPLHPREYSFSFFHNYFNTFTKC
jgi:hypothetical protein